MEERCSNPDSWRDEFEASRRRLTQATRLWHSAIGAGVLGSAWQDASYLIVARKIGGTHRLHMFPVRHRTIMRRAIVLA